MPQTDQAKPASTQTSKAEVNPATAIAAERRDAFAAAYGAALIVKGVNIVQADRFGRQLATLVDGVLAELDRPRGA